MKYVIYIAPPVEIENELHRYTDLIASKIVSIPKKPVHCTLMNPHLYGDEEEILEKLQQIKTEKFTITCTHVERFDEDLTVVRLEKNPSLLQLHEQIVYAMQPFIDWKSTPPILEKYQDDALRQAIYKKTGSPYFLACYNPHITIAMTNSEYAQIPDFFKGKSFEVKEFVIVRKELDKSWTRIGTFSLE